MWEPAEALDDSKVFPGGALKFRQLLLPLGCRLGKQFLTPTQRLFL